MSVHSFTVNMLASEYLATFPCCVPLRWISLTDEVEGNGAQHPELRKRQRNTVLPCVRVGKGPEDCASAYLSWNVWSSKRCLLLMHGMAEPLRKRMEADTASRKRSPQGVSSIQGIAQSTMQPTYGLLEVS